MARVLSLLVEVGAGVIFCVVSAGRGGGVAGCSVADDGVASVFIPGTFNKKGTDVWVLL